MSVTTQGARVADAALLREEADRLHEQMREHEGLGRGEPDPAEWRDPVDPVPGIVGIERLRALADALESITSADVALLRAFVDRYADGGCHSDVCECEPDSPGEASERARLRALADRIDALLPSE